MVHNNVDVALFWLFWGRIEIFVYIVVLFCSTEKDLQKCILNDLFIKQIIFFNVFQFYFKIELSNRKKFPALGKKQK